MSIENNEKKQTICTQCVMDISDSGIFFNSQGICNHCLKRQALLSGLPKSVEERKLQIETSITKIKLNGRGKDYDCLIGISGGLDSCFLAHWACEQGLRPLLFHYDNGWNSEQAVHNIEKIASQLSCDLVTFVNDWEEFKNIQRSLILAGVLDLELISDQAIVASMFKEARKHNIKYILSGHNIATETHLPDNWTWMKFDAKNIRAIYKEYTGQRIRKTPLLGIIGYIAWQKLRGLQFYWPLNYVEYSKDVAEKILKEAYGWEKYVGKHGESNITRFYQNCYLPKRFNIDKRKSHLSSLVCAGEISREEALKTLSMKASSEQDEMQDINFVAKKLSFDVDTFTKLMQEKPRSHDEFSSEIWVFYLLQKIKRYVFGNRFLLM